MIALPHMLAAGAIGVMIAGGAGYFIGRSDGRDIELAAQARADRAAATAERELQAVRDRLVRENRDAETHRQSNVREIYRETQKIVDRPVYRNVCIDSDGVRLLDQGVENANGAHRPVAPGGAAEVQQDPA